MNVSWNGKYDSNEIVSRIEQTRNLGKDGKISFTSGFEFKHYEVVLFSMLHFSPPIPEVVKRGFIWESLIRAGEKGIITPKSFLNEINKITGAYLRKPMVRYVLVTTLSIMPIIKLRSVRIGGTYITFRPNLAKVFQESRNKLEIASKPYLFSEIPKGYTYIKVSVLARSTHEAAEKALNSIDLMRGIFNWLENRQHSLQMSFGSRKPINKIVLGPIHTLHYPDGKLAAETWWYETKHYRNIEPFDISKNIEKSYQFLSNVTKRLANCKYRKEVEDGIILYTRALDEWDWEGAFLKLWSVLEQLTNTDHYEATITRASFLFDERNLCQQILRHLKDYRNMFVHEAADNSEIETYIYQLKSFVEELIGFHIGNSYGFNSIQEATEFLDLPSDKQELSDRIEMMKYAQKYLKHV